MSNGLPPALNIRTRTVILGSFPSEASLAARQYYAHPRNQFWRLMGKLLGHPLVDCAYPERITRLLNRGIGLWDVFSACEREGSLDADIRKARVNDFSKLREIAPRLSRVCFNGQTSGKHAPGFREAGYEVLVLPSSSPAHTMAFDLKLAQWRGTIRK